MDQLLDQLLDQLRRRIAGLLLGLGILGLATGAAVADLRVCNTTTARIGLAIGYLDGPVWVTEGWFNLRPNRCETVIRGRLSSRFFYVHAVDYDRGGEWTGPNVLCTRDVEFSIRGPLDCYARGFERAGFIEIDTGQQNDWTIELGDGGLVTGR